MIQNPNVDDNSMIGLIGADGERVNLYKMTSAKGCLQSLRVAKKFEELLELWL